MQPQPHAGRLPTTTTELVALLQRRARGPGVAEALVRAICLRAAALLSEQFPEVLIDPVPQQASSETEFPLQEFFARRPPKFVFTAVDDPTWKQPRH